jgi:septal ring factor EnvC (AmiA/AmiB activator)
LLWLSCAPAFAQSATPSPTNTAVTEEQIKLEQKISEYEKGLNDKRAESNTLAGQLQYLDKESYVTRLKIEESEAKIIRVKKEAELLAGRIVNLDQKLDLQLKNYVIAARERYKQRTVSLIDYILNADSATGLIHTLKYRKVTEDKAQQLVIQTEETKQNFEKTLNSALKLEKKNFPQFLSTLEKIPVNFV